MTTPRAWANGLFHVLAWAFFALLTGYYLTGHGGPMLLAVAAMPLALALGYLDEARKGALYPALGAWGGLTAAVVYASACIVASAYLVVQFEAVRIDRVGIWSAPDLAAGAVIVLLVLEYTRRKYLPLFVLNLALLAYAVYGASLPGALRHGGIDWSRALSATSLEMSTGVFDRLAQLGLTLIGSFILVLAVLRAFGCIDSILAGATRLAARRTHWLPQAAVAGSFAVAAVSGSGAANAATTGSATIPALIRGGLPRVRAAAIETAASLGGQLMPPLMGIAAFMMAELMGVSYFDVAARGFAPAAVYFIGVSFAVYLLSIRHRPALQRAHVPAAPLARTDWFNLGAYVAAVAGLIYLMGVLHYPAMTAAQTMFLALFIALAGSRVARERLRGLWERCVRLVETFSSTTAELTVLLSTLGILTALFTVTGVPTKVGVLMMDMAGVHLALMVAVALLFGILVGMGLPAAPTYIILAVVATPFMIRAGIDPWVAHFFAFFVAVFGELSPPTSVTAAVTSRIAEAPFMRTMFAALGLCLPLLLLVAGVFTRPGIVLDPGLGQLGPAAALVAGAAGLAYALHGTVPGPGGTRAAVRALLTVTALAAVLHPADAVAATAAVLTVLTLVTSARLTRNPEKA